MKNGNLMDEINCYSDLSRWAIRGTFESHIPSTTRGSDRNRNRGNTFRFDTAIDHAPLLESQTYLSEMQILLGQRDSPHCHASSKGKF